MFIRYTESTIKSATSLDNANQVRPLGGVGGVGVLSSKGVGVCTLGECGGGLFKVMPPPIYMSTPQRSQRHRR